MSRLLQWFSSSKTEREKLYKNHYYCVYVLAFIAKVKDKEKPFFASLGFLYGSGRHRCLFVFSTVCCQYLNTAIIGIKVLSFSSACPLSKLSDVLEKTHCSSPRQTVVNPTEHFPNVIFCHLKKKLQLNRCKINK